MPYIPQDERYLMELGREPYDAGQLNFAITTLIREYLERRGIRYSTMNEVVGVLECAKLELYRRMVAPYEDEKIKENGDVY